MRQPIDGIRPVDHKPWRISVRSFSSDRSSMSCSTTSNRWNSLRNKVSQFPSGSSFVWSEASATPSPEGAKNFVELSPLPHGARNVPAQRNGSLTFPLVFPGCAYTRASRKGTLDVASARVTYSKSGRQAERSGGVRPKSDNGRRRLGN